MVNKKSFGDFAIMLYPLKISTQNPYVRLFYLNPSPLHAAFAYANRKRANRTPRCWLLPRFEFSLRRKMYALFPLVPRNHALFERCFVRWITLCVLISNKIRRIPVHCACAPNNVFSLRYHRFGNNAIVFRE